MAGTPNSFDLDRPPTPRSIVLPVLLVLTGAIAVGSLLWNVMAFSLHLADKEVKSHALSLEKRSQELESLLTQDQAERKVLDAKVSQLESELKASADQLKQAAAESQTQVNAALADASRAKKSLEDLQRKPDLLPMMSEASVVKRVEVFSVRTQLSDAAKKAGLLEGATAEEVKAIGRGNGFLFADDAPAIILLSVDMLKTDGGLIASVRVSILERWRVPASDRSWLVTVSDREELVLCDQRGPARSVASAIARVVEDIGSLRKN